MLNKISALKAKLLAAIASILILGSVMATSPAQAAIGDLWRVGTTYIDSAGLLNGVDQTFTGTSTLTSLVAPTFSSTSSKFGRTAISANTTLSTTSGNFIGITNITAVTNLGNATTLGSGRWFVVCAETAGNCTIATASNISGGAGADVVNVSTPGRYYSNGTGWIKF